MYDQSVVQNFDKDLISKTSLNIEDTTNLKHTDGVKSMLMIYNMLMENLKWVNEE
jgi:hypothetical protein